MTSEPGTAARDADAAAAPGKDPRAPVFDAGRTLVPYFLAGALFVLFGVIEPRFMLNWSPGIALLFLVAWAIPAAWRRWRRR
jgi:hypothetical protein